ncbi:MAG: divalent-cation tolerance protein CutA [Alphaproteobacteria bacterium]|nr:divalent-cation tolerance protein CutA [Alphaproteobacteria bacterium]
MPVIIYMTAASQDEAQSISKTLVEERLVACANILPAHSSLYWWEGKVESAQEVAVIFKSRAELFPQIEARIRALHSYDVPCIVSWPIEQGHAPFLQWIEAETKK